MVKIETSFLVGGRKRFRGHLIRIDSADNGDMIVIAVTMRCGEDKEAQIPLDAIESANLILTDELIREALQRDKALRNKANGLDQEDETDNDS